MVAFLDDLSKETVVDPPYSATSGDLNIQVDTAAQHSEFENALRAAINLFDRDAGTLKHLLLLTAGPTLITMYVPTTAFSWDTSIDVDLFASQVPSGGSNTQCNQLYWPGVDVSGFCSRHHSRFKVSATVSNGRDTDMIHVLDSNATSGGYWLTTTEAYLYSDIPLRQEIRWSVLLDNKAVAGYVESPKVIHIEDGMQYARLIGSSKYLFPLAQQMPVSLASTLGFIDTAYSLVTLESDTVPSSVQSQYALSGVPNLTPDDIFPAAADQASIPVDKWLADHPPSSMGQALTWFNYYSYYPKRFIALAAGVDMVMVEDDAVGVQIIPNAATRTCRNASGGNDHRDGRFGISGLQCRIHITGEEHHSQQGIITIHEIRPLVN